MNYRHLFLARKFNLVSDIDIEKWAYHELESSQSPDWWFSFLVSASSLDSVSSILIEAAEDEEKKDSFYLCDPYGDFEPWLIFLGLAAGRLNFDHVYSEVFEMAENDGSVEALLILRTLEGIYDFFHHADLIDGKRWVDLFSDSQLIFFEKYIDPFFTCFDIDPRKWLEREIKQG